MRFDYVNGGMATRNSADFLRSSETLCGERGRWYEAKWTA
jgi:hypothetical protein